MGYNTTIGPPRRMEEFLERLKKHRKTMEFATQNPSSLAYKLREAIYASQFHDRYEHYHELNSLYTFEERAGKVVAQYRGVDPKQVETKEGEPLEPEPAPERPAMTVGEAKTLEGVVGAAMQHGGGTEEIRFPNAILPTRQKEKLFAWAAENDWEIIDQDEGGLTLTRKDVPSEITWRPE